MAKVFMCDRCKRLEWGEEAPKITRSHAATISCSQQDYDPDCNSPNGEKIEICKSCLKSFQNWRVHYGG